MLNYYNISLDIKIIDIINPLVVLLIKNNKRENIIASCKILVKYRYDVYMFLNKIFKNNNIFYKNLFDENDDINFALYIDYWLTHLVHCLDDIDYITVFCCNYEKDYFINFNFENWITIINNIDLDKKNKLYDLYKYYINSNTFIIKNNVYYACYFCDKK
jgi:hypothetical protein